jgi:hypothetical protein
MFGLDSNLPPIVFWMFLKANNERDFENKQRTQKRIED